MRKYSLRLCPVIVGWLVLALSVAGADQPNHDAIKLLHDGGEIISLIDIIQDARRRFHDGRILDAELKSGKDSRLVYEIQFLDGSGALHELYYDAKLGKLMAYEEYEVASDGTLRSIKYDADTGKPLAYEIYLKTEDGKLQSTEYTLKPIN